MRVPVREQRRAPHQQSRDKITMRSDGGDGVAAVAEEESASPRQGDHCRHARNFRQSRLGRRLCTFEACGCLDALFPQDGLLRRESPRAHAQRGRARVVGGGRASGCSVRRSGVQRSRAHVKGGYLLSRPTLRFCANDFSRCSGSSPSPLAAAANERVFSLAAKETVDTVTSAAAGGGGAGVWCVRK